MSMVYTLISLFRFIYVRFISRYSIIFYLIISGIIFVISLADCSFLVYTNATDFCMIILYPATLQNSLTNANSFGEMSLGFFMYSMSSANSDSLLLPF